LSNPSTRASAAESNTSETVPARGVGVACIGDGADSVPGALCPVLGTGDGGDSVPSTRCSVPAMGVTRCPVLGARCPAGGSRLALVLTTQMPDPQSSKRRSTVVEPVNTSKLPGIKWIQNRPPRGDATGYRLPATGYGLPATGYRLLATRFPLPPVRCTLFSRE